MSTDDLCGRNSFDSRAFYITAFVNEVMSYKFEETPDYNKLRFLLEKVLLDKKITPSKKYDWMSQEEQLMLVKQRKQVAANRGRY